MIHTTPLANSQRNAATTAGARSYRPAILMKLKHFFVVPALIAATHFAMPGMAPAAQAQELLPQGTFDQVAAGNKPGGWDIKWGPENVSMAGDPKNRWVQLRDGAVLSQVAKFPERAKTVVVS